MKQLKNGRFVEDLLGIFGRNSGIGKYYLLAMKKEMTNTEVDDETKRL